jgi:hypothetical protein
MLRTSWYYLGVSKRAVRMISRKGRNLSTSFFSMFRFQWKILIDVKAPSAGAKSLCIPHDQARFGEFPEGENQKCVQCGEKAKRWTLFGRSKFSFITLRDCAD